MSGESIRHKAVTVRPAWKRYGFAVLCVLMAAFARWAAQRWIGGAYPMLPVFLAAIAAAWYGGFGPSMLVALGGLGILWLLPQQARPSRPGLAILGLLSYFIFSFGIATLGGLMARARRRIAEQIDELARQHEQLSATLHSIGDAVIVTDDAGRVVSLNPVAESLTGWANQDASGLPLEEVFRIVNEQSRQTVESPVQQVLREGQIVGLANHTVLISKDGRERPIDDSAAPIHDASGRLAGVVLVFRDVTQRRQSERQLQDEARRKDEFLALLAHELRNPLAPIRSALDVLKVAGDDAAASQEARDMAERQLRHMTRLVDDLLDVSRIMRGKVELRKERIELKAAVERAVETARPVIDADRHALLVSLPEEPIWLHADLVRLAQVLGNLLTNAAKYTEPGGRIELSAAVEDGLAVVRVTDNGIGLASEVVPQVFDMFMQVAPGASRSQGGLGIGLTLVKNLIEMHGGTVAAHSAGAGQGSQFVIRVPLASEEIILATTEPQTPTPSERRRVLVVDDNVDAAQSLALLLRLRGHDVRVAFGGEEALASVRSLEPEVVFLDIGMPGMDGYQVARRLRTDFDSTMRLFAVTGWGTDHDRERSRQAGFNGHLTKPVDLGQLETALSGIQAAAEAPCAAAAVDDAV